MGRVFVNGRPAGTGFLAGPGGVALTAAHVVATTKAPPFRQVTGPVQLELAGQRIDAEVEIPDENLDIAVLRLATTPEVEPRPCGPTPSLTTQQHPDFRLAGYPSRATEQMSAFTGELVGRDDAGRLELSPGPPQGMSGGPIIVAGCAVGVQSISASAVPTSSRDAATSGFPWGYAAALDQLPDDVIALLNWQAAPEETGPFGNRADATTAPTSTQGKPPVLQVVLSRGEEPDTFTIRRTRAIWGPESDISRPPRPFRPRDFGKTLAAMLPKLKPAWLRWKRGMYWNEVVCLVSLPEYSESYPDFEDAPMRDTSCGRKFLCLALSSQDHSPHDTPDVVRLSSEPANAFEYDGPDLVALASQRANREVAIVGGATATAVGPRGIFDACDELALIIVQKNGALPELRSRLFGDSDAVELPTLLQRITAARAEDHKLLVMWNDGQFMIEEEEVLSAIGATGE